METPEHTPAEVPATLIVKPQPEGARLRAWARFLIPFAMVLAIGVFAPPIYQLVNHLNRNDTELDCRNDIGNALQGWQAIVSGDVAEGLSNVLRGVDNADLLERLDQDRDRQAQVASLRAAAVSTCQDNPSYDLPADLQPPVPGSVP